jgi:predicted nicotinamide N-methyase
MATLALPPPRPAEFVMPSSATRPQLSVSERAKRLHRQLAWRRARGCDPTFVMELDGTTITTLQTPSGEIKGLGTGASVWDTAIVLARYLAKERTTFNPKKVVELGSGNGLLGMVCAVLFEEANITLTDQKPLLPLIKQNMEHNLENIPQLARVAVEEYNWGEETSMKDINLIICSDCVYDMAPWDLLVDSLRLLCRGDECRILISMEHRYRSTEEKFFNYASQHFDIHTIPREEHDEDYCADDIDLYVLSTRR